MENKEEKATPTTFRITPSTNEKFKELAQSIGLTQEEMLSSLISTYELENAKALIVNREKEIDEFKAHITRLINIYLNSLELNQNSELRIQEKFTVDINKKVEIINLLQGQISELKENLKENKVLLTNTLNENTKLTDETNNLKDTLNTKEKLIKEYIEKIDTLTSLVMEYKNYKNTYLNLKEEIEISNVDKEKLLYSNKEMQLEKNNLEKRIELLENQLTQYNETISNLKIEHKENIQQIKTECSNMIKSKNKELEQASNSFNEQLQTLTLKLNTEASRGIRECEEKLEEQRLLYEQKIKDIKDNFEAQHKCNLDKIKLDYEKQIFEKDKQIDKLKKK